MRIDLHSHSLCSDGTQTPTELVAAAHAAGIDVLGITDHDTIQGWPEAAAVAQDYEIGLIRGMEVSCSHNGVSVHMLSYLHSEQESQLSACVATLRSARAERAKHMVELLSADYPIDWASLEASAGPRVSIGRPHLADALIACGAATTRAQAFAEILHARGPYYVPIPTVSPIAAIEMIHAAGGVAVFAHPKARARGRVVDDAAMRDIIGAGLNGIEIDHRDNPPGERVQLRALAAAHGLIATGSSDYHGAGKPNFLGEHLTSRQSLDRICETATGTPPILP